MSWRLAWTILAALLLGLVISCSAASTSKTRKYIVEDGTGTGGVPADEAVDEKLDDGGATIRPPNTTKSIAPAADFEADISPTGNCTEDIGAFCKGLKAGGAALLDCLSARIKAEETANDDKGSLVSMSCKLEVRAFKIEMYKGVKRDKKTESACKVEIANFCEDEFVLPESSSINLACLRKINQVEPEALTEACKAEIFRAQQDAASDVKMDPDLNELCSSDAERLCKDVTPGDGRVQDCLRSNGPKLAWGCQVELFRQEVETAADIRLNVRLFRACLNDKEKFCAEVPPGDTRVKDCLELHRLDPDFSPQCKEEFDRMMERRATDFRLDPSLKKFCKTDINEVLGVFCGHMWCTEGITAGWLLTVVLPRCPRHH